MITAIRQSRALSRALPASSMRTMLAKVQPAAPLRCVRLQTTQPGTTSPTPVQSTTPAPPQVSASGPPPPLPPSRPPLQPKPKSKHKLVYRELTGPVVRVLAVATIVYFSLHIVWQLLDAREQTALEDYVRGTLEEDVRKEMAVKGEKDVQSNARVS